MGRLKQSIERDIESGLYDGAVTIEEFRDVVDDPAVRKWLSAMELEVPDVDAVFRLLDDHRTGRLTA